MIFPLLIKSSTSFVLKEEELIPILFFVFGKGVLHCDNTSFLRRSAEDPEKFLLLLKIL